MPTKSVEKSDPLPKIPAWFQNGFHRFLTPYLRRHFHAIAIEASSKPLANVKEDQPLIVYANHPSWWDPLLAHFLNKNLFPGRQFWAPIDADALKQYEVFKKLGFFGVQSDTKSGAATFLKMSRRILKPISAGESPVFDSALWITPEGRFADARDHDATLMPGLAHLCHSMTSGIAIPLAMEYVFWDERLPMCLVRLGDPLSFDDQSLGGKEQWAVALSSKLRETQCSLATLSIKRDSAPFENLLAGKKGVGGLYDWMRRSKATLTGQSFKASHGDHFG